MTGVQQSADGVEVHLSDGRSTSCDLLVAADGGRAVRRVLFPEQEPGYAGYVAGRGIVEGPALSPETFDMLHEAITCQLLHHSHPRLSGPRRGRAQLELGRSVPERTRRAGIRSRVEGAWPVGNHLPFGLYPVGDSAIEM